MASCSGRKLVLRPGGTVERGLCSGSVQSEVFSDRLVCSNVFPYFGMDNLGVGNSILGVDPALLLGVAVRDSLFVSAQSAEQQDL